jgi:hypothetical protein
MNHLFGLLGVVGLFVLRDGAQDRVGIVVSLKIQHGERAFVDLHLVIGENLGGMSLVGFGASRATEARDFACSGSTGTLLSVCVVWPNAVKATQQVSHRNPKRPILKQSPITRKPTNDFPFHRPLQQVTEVTATKTSRSGTGSSDEWL